MQPASALQVVETAASAEAEAARGHIETARILLDNHWLGHAEQQCQAAVRLDPSARDATAALIAEIAARRAARDTLDLSKDHAPIAIGKSQGTVISTLHFRPQSDDRLKREAFRQAVTYIDVETSSQCNRRCSYCPNAFHDRLTSNRFMDDAVFNSLLNNLRSIDYCHELHFVGFNEPLMHHDDILGRIAAARRLLPRADIVVFTNGDYLDLEYLDQLIAAGVDRMIVSVHLAPEKPYTEQAIFDRINRLAHSLGTPLIPLSYAPGAYINVRFVHEKIQITVRQTDYTRFGSNRASSLHNVGPQIDVRTAACLLPIHQFILGHQGKVSPCCTMMSDDPRHAAHLVGDVAKASSIFDIYAGPAMVNWRRSLFHVGPKRAPCDKCADNQTAPDLNNPAIYDPWAHYVSLTPLEPALLTYAVQAG